jgi:hypothetical protein
MENLSLEMDVHEFLDNLTEGPLKDMCHAVMIEPECFTKKGRLNKSGLARLLGLNMPQVEALLGQLRAIWDRDNKKPRGEMDPRGEMAGVDFIS